MAIKSVAKVLEQIEREVEVLDKEIINAGAQKIPFYQLSKKRKVKELTSNWESRKEALTKLANTIKE